MHLPALRQFSGGFSIVELDRLSEIFQKFGIADPQKDSSLRLYLERLLIDMFSAEASGVICGPDESFELIEFKNDTAGLLLRVEKLEDPVDPQKVPIIAPNWSIEHIRGNYGVACLELYYNPRESNSVKKQQLLRELRSSCQAVGIDLFLKLIIYPLAGEEANLFEVQFTALAELRAWCDLIAIEYFEDPLHAATITTHLDCPWLVFERGVSYETAKETIRTGVENGASGFVISDVLWSDFVENLQGAEVTPALLEQYVRGTLRDRLLELTRIVHEGMSATDQMVI